MNIEYINFNRRIGLFFLFLALCAFGIAQDTTWYTLASGDWDDPSIWTLDPSGSLPNNPDNLTPTTAITGATHSVSILSGRTISVSTDNKTNATLTVSGRLEFNATSGHIFNEVRGGGKILLKADNFPVGDSTHFISKDQGEGTVVFDSSGYDLTTPMGFYNLEIELDDASDVITLLADYQINGNFSLVSGKFQINNNISTTPLDITVEGNVSISSDASIVVGTADANNASGIYRNLHNLYVGGDFVSYGEVRLTNQTVPNYTIETTSGAATLHFTNASDNNFKCYNTTDLYNLHINKGTDATYELTLYVNDKSYFAIFGPNNNSYTRTVAHPIHGKSLWIEAGTLRLKGEVVIPSLTEGGSDWSIGSNANLILDGENVEVYVTADNSSTWTGFSHGTPSGVSNSSGSQGISVYGTFEVEDGYFSTGNSAGIIYRNEAAGAVKISGGEVDINQLRLSGSSSSGFYSYIQSGGIFRLNGNGGVSNAAALFSLNDNDMYFAMSGGQVIVEGFSTYTYGAIDIQCGAGNYLVTGGEVVCDWDGNAAIYSTADFYDFTVTANDSVSLQSPLTVLNDINLETDSYFEANGNDMFIGRNFSIEEGCNFKEENNSITFNGTEDGVLYIGYSQINNGYEEHFHKVIIDKPTDKSITLTGDLQKTSQYMEDNGYAHHIARLLQIEDTLMIESGILDQGEHSIRLFGETIVKEDGQCGVYIPGTTHLYALIMLKDADVTIYTEDGATFGNVKVNPADNTDIISFTSNVYVKRLSYFHGRINMGTYNLKVDYIHDRLTTDNYDITDGSETTEMIYGAGNASDGGLSVLASENGTYGFPVGVSGKYTPVEIVVSNYSDDGYITITPVDHVLWTLSGGTTKVLDYYWSLDHSDFTTEPDVYLTFSYLDADVDGNDNSYRAARVINYATIESLGNGSVDNSTHEIFYETGILTSGDYSAGNPSVFNTSVRILYARKNGEWHDYTTWSTDPDGDSPLNNVNQLPGSSDIVVIGESSTNGNENKNYAVAISETHDDYAPINIAALCILRYGSGESSLVTVGQNGADCNFGILTNRDPDAVDPESTADHGSKIIISGPDLPSGDFGEFLQSDNTIWTYSRAFPGCNSAIDNDDGGNLSTVYYSSYTIGSSITEYPILQFEYSGRSSGYIEFPATDIVVHHDIRFFKDHQYLIFNNATNGDVWVEESIEFNSGNSFTIEFQATGTARTLTVEGDINFSNQSGTYMVEDATSALKHKIQLYGNVINPAASSDFILYRASTKAMGDIEFVGEENSVFEDMAAIPSFNQMIMNKGTDQTYSLTMNSNFSLGADASGTYLEKPIQLLNGTLIIDNSNIDTDLSTGSDDFNIPSTSTLQLTQGTLNVIGDDNGIWLDGKLIIDGGTLDLSTGSGNGNNYIEYTASGNSEIQVDLGTLRVGSQIRRNLITDDGILTFSQNSSNTTILIGENGTPSSGNRRGIFEVLNTGSSFTQAADANITIVQSQQSPAEASLYLYPETYSLGSGSSFTFGNGTSGGTTMGIRSTVDMQNIIISSQETLSEWIVPLTINEDLTIQSTATLDANNLDLTVNGDINNSGTYTPAGNTTYLSGSGDQRINGDIDFYNLTKTSSSELWLAYNNGAITISNYFDLQDGSLRDSSNTVTLMGNCNFDGIHIHGSQAGNGIYFNGNSEQELTGSGTFGKLSIDNPAGVLCELGNNFTITDTLNLIDGVFSIGKNLLTLSINAEVEGNPGFSSSNMIQTNASFTDYGVRKYFPSGAKNFVYPIGSGGKYTPVTFDISQNTSSTGYLTLKAADEPHPSVIEDSETPEIVDEENVLQYHWVIRASDLSGFIGDAYMEYLAADALCNSASYDTSDYITARLLNDGSGSWNKYTSDKVDGSNTTLIFNFGQSGAVTHEAISGDYTAGIDDGIPDQVSFYESNTDGSWPTTTIWTPNIIGGPNGAMVRINAADSVTIPANYISSYTTEVLGVANIGTTIGHRFGEVTGTGLIYTEREVLPAGSYDVFFSSAGGTVEFGGTNDYDVLGDYAVVNNLTFSGSGLRRLPSNNIVLNGDLYISGSSGLNVDNDNDIDIEINGDLVRTGGTFNAFSGVKTTSTILFSSSLNQNITGDFTGNNSLHTLEVDNPNGITISSGVVDVEYELILTNGIITTSATDTLRIGLTTIITPESGSTSSYINGPLTKVMGSSSDFVFPIGKSGGLGLIEVVDVTGITGVETDVTIEYFFDNPQIALGSGLGTGVSSVSSTEYWGVNILGGGQSKLSITLDGSSDLANAAASLSDLILVGWNSTTSQWEQVGGSYSTTGTSSSGTLSCNTVIDYSSYSYITIGSDVVITAVSASIVSSDATICEGGSTSFILAMTGGNGVYDLSYNDGTSSFVLQDITSPYTLNITPASTTTYTITAVQDNDASPVVGTIVGDSDFIANVNATPLSALTASSNPSCLGVAVLFAASGGLNYAFYEDATIVQSGTTDSYTTSTLPLGTTAIDVIVTSSAGCSSSLGSVNIDQLINATPAPVISGITASCEQAVDAFTTALDVSNTYTWSVTGGAVNSGQGTNSADILWSDLTVGAISDSFTVTVSESNGSCAGTDDYTVTVYKIPDTGPAYHINNTQEY